MTGEDPKSDIKIIERSKKLDKPPVIGKYTNSVVVSLAILEFIGILGFLYFLISGDFQTLYILVVVSGIAMIYYRPKMKELDDVSIVSEANISSLNQGMQPTE
ncbi:MAG: hypothetical protein SV375_20385 [Thermodesulfobacteriota bacterium]|nr:hypothetical protein [Thermodesulfobacteriota bacterium]